MLFLAKICLPLVLCITYLGSSEGNPFDAGFKVPIPSHDVPLEYHYIPKVDEGELDEYGRRAEFKYKYLTSDGQVWDTPGTGRLEVSSTLAISSNAEATGVDIIRLMTRNMPVQVFNELARRGSVGLFTYNDKTTIFPEYEHLRDRPECAGTCAGACSDTCTGDGRKYDSLAGVGGSRGTCLDDNFMCTAADPYYNTYNVLVHEFAHTIHQYAIPGSSDYLGKITNAWYNARLNAIWDPASYAMSNELEYFAEGAGVFFNTNHHCCSNGGMNSCGRPSGQYCQSEQEARAWLQAKDPMLFETLDFTFTNHRSASSPGGLSICHKINQQ